MPFRDLSVTSIFTMQKYSYFCELQSLCGKKCFVFTFFSNCGWNYTIIFRTFAVKLQF
jgi:hypothetical protein